MKLLLTVLSAFLLLGGCSLRPEVKPPITRYYLQPEIVPVCRPQKSNKLLQLNVSDVVPSLLGKNIVYKKSDLKTGSYLYSKWNQPPSRSISIALYTVLKQRKIFKDTIYADKRIESDLTLEIKVMQFEHRFTQTEDSYALVGLDGVIYDAQRRVLSSRFFSSQIKAASDDAQGGVKAINEALGKVLSELVCWSAEQGDLE
jgi:cholesterol transport system auxiliary component